jgi:hypothetical protein
LNEPFLLGVWAVVYQARKLSSWSVFKQFQMLSLHLSKGLGQLAYPLFRSSLLPARSLDWSWIPVLVEQGKRSDPIATIFSICAGGSKSVEGRCAKEAYTRYGSFIFDLQGPVSIMVE